jgi:uncharacterized protein YjbJ (UPF0337 family)
MDDRNIRSRTEDARKSAAADKTKGRVNETIGKVKQKVGDLTGNEDLEVKGAAQRAEGKKDRAKGEIKDKVEDVKDYAKAGAEMVKDKFSRDKH